MPREANLTEPFWRGRIAVPAEFRLNVLFRNKNRNALECATLCCQTTLPFTDPNLNALEQVHAPAVAHVLKRIRMEGMCARDKHPLRIAIGSPGRRAGRPNSSTSIHIGNKIINTCCNVCI